MTMTTSGPWAMAAMGLTTSVLAPAIVVATRARHTWWLLRGPVWLVLPSFVVLHAVVTLAMPPGGMSPGLHLGLEAALLVGAIAFWLPVLGRPARLDAAAGSVYLFLAAPTLDLAGVWMVARGDAVGGLSMIVGMLPIGVAAMVLTWRWVTADEERVRAEQSGSGARRVDSY